MAQRQRRLTNLVGPAERTFDMSSPANRRELDMVEDLAILADEAGMSLIDMALAFVINHPGAISVIVGPPPWTNSSPAYRPQMSPFPATFPDRIDEVVTPGVTVNPDDNSYGTTELAHLARRR